MHKDGNCPPVLTHDVNVVYVGMTGWPEGGSVVLLCMVELPGTGPYAVFQ